MPPANRKPRRAVALATRAVFCHSEALSPVSRALALSESVPHVPARQGLPGFVGSVSPRCPALAWRLAGANSGWKAIVCITRGGLVPAAIISRELGIRVIETVLGRLLSRLCLAGRARGPEGSHAFAAREWRRERADRRRPHRHRQDGGGGGAAMLPKAHFATVYAKPKGRPLVDTFVTEVSQTPGSISPGTWALPTRSRSRTTTRAEKVRRNPFAGKLVCRSHNCRYW